MKSIEEAAKEHASKTWRESVVGEWDSNELKLFCNNDFIHGARFAQRWIPVEEELPPVDVFILAKTKDEDIYIEIIKSDTGEYCHNLEVTHWRPIELK